MTDSASSPVEAVDEAELETDPDDVPPSLFHTAWGERLLSVLAISVGGFLGANARHVIGSLVVERVGATFPWGTLLINISGSFVFGFYLTLVTERISGRASTRLFFATGFLGAYTTFSTFSFEVVQLVSQGEVAHALAYVAGSLAVGLAAATAGMLSAQTL